MKDRLILIAGLALLCVAATVTTKYQGTFIGSHYGLGTGLTNASGVGYATTAGTVAAATNATYAVLATNAIGLNTGAVVTAVLNWGSAARTNASWISASGNMVCSNAQGTVTAAVGTLSASVGTIIGSNTPASWPAAPATLGACAIVVSNGFPYMLLSTNGVGGGTNTWTGTNAIGW